jgi:hypothetical protein
MIANSKLLYRLFSLTTLLISASCVTSAAGSRNGIDVSIAFPEASSRFGSTFWASGGAGVAGLGLPGAPFANPAALNYPNVEIYVEAAQRFNTTWIAGIDYNGQTIVPAYGSVGFSTGRASLAFGYANLFDQDYSTQLLITTPAFPEGTGQTAGFGSSSRTHAIFGSVGYPVDEQLSVGLTGGLHYIHVRNYILNTSADGGAIGFLLVGGGLFRLSEHLTIGGTIHYESPATFSQLYSTAQAMTPDTSRGGLYQIQESFDFSARYPWTFNLGAAWSVSPSVDILVSGEYEHWSHLVEGYSNLVQFHLGTQIELSEAVSVQAGFFTQAAPQDLEENPLSENFLTAGFRWNVSRAVAVSANAIDSHLSSTSPVVPFSNSPDARFRQAAVSLGVTYTFLKSPQE